MKTRIRLLVSFSVAGWAVFLSVHAYAGPFDEAGIAAESGAFRVWGTHIAEYSPASGAEANAMSGNALGKADGLTVSLGDLSQLELSNGATSGSITLRFDEPIRNGPGWDFAVFENAFAINTESVFAELGFVEVSTDGEAFARFESVSLTDERLNLPTPAFSGIDPTDVDGLAGKHLAGLSTPFDLNDLAHDSFVASGTVRLHDIRYVRIVDIPGSASAGEPLLAANGTIAFADTAGNPILDPWNTTASGVAGFDLDAIGGRYARDTSYIELIRENMFKVGTDLWSGDLNADGVTDGADFNLWNSVDFVDPRPSPTIVPEPVGLVPTAWTGVLVLLFRRRRIS